MLLEAYLAFLEASWASFPSWQDDIAWDSRACYPILEITKAWVLKRLAEQLLAGLIMGSLIEPLPWQ